MYVSMLVVYRSPAEERLASEIKMLHQRILIKGKNNVGEEWSEMQDLNKSCIWSKFYQNRMIYKQVIKVWKYQGPVVQSVVSLTGSLRVISLTVLVDSIYNILIFFAEKMWVAFALQKLITFFQQKISSLDVNFNESLTNDVVSF